MARSPHRCPLSYGGSSADVIQLPDMAVRRFSRYSSLLLGLSKLYLEGKPRNRNSLEHYIPKMEHLQFRLHFRENIDCHSQALSPAYVSVLLFKQ